MRRGGQRVTRGLNRQQRINFRRQSLNLNPISGGAGGGAGGSAG